MGSGIFFDSPRNPRKDAEKESDGLPRKDTESTEAPFGRNRECLKVLRSEGLKDRIDRYL
ncbi:hypothetical protein C8D92_108143 [Tamilnaduibacter salinus]|uniref:Uncharacterized protein n=1 Tax=Tamilnaduibacter salinus TaxID=1484056 RepID=A0A2U1CUQ7_9GAMM|nr:hypothetical protein C8D92_108143 [Tamilnaduibacter salinus]